MKKTIIIILIIIVSGVLAYLAYINFAKESNPLTCQNVQDCINKIDCGPDEQPYCQPGSLATGKEYPEPICVCLNPNLDY